jgi:hypothetical protein
MVTLPSCQPRLRWQPEMSKLATPPESSGKAHIPVRIVGGRPALRLDSILLWDDRANVDFSRIHGAETFANGYREPTCMNILRSCRDRRRA